MKSRFSDVAAEHRVSSSIYNPALLPLEEEGFTQYKRKKEIKALAQFYGSEATVSNIGKIHPPSPPPPLF